MTKKAQVQAQREQTWTDNARPTAITSGVGGLYTQMRVEGGSEQAVITVVVSHL